MDEKYIKYELKMSRDLYGIIKDYLYEMEEEDNFNQFILEAIVEKFNAENEIFNNDIDENGWIDE